MSRKVLVFLASLTAVASFIGTSYARTAGPPDLPANLPAHALPNVTVSDATQLAISNLIGSETAARYGISPESFTRVRLLATTEAGPLYIVPGRSGECVALAFAVACGNAGPREPIVGLLVADASHPDAVGGGIIAGANERISVVRKGGSSFTAIAVRGGFVVSASQHAKVGDALEASG
jgi:hypothetical protein